jgi:hypothetical protein
MSRPLTPSQSQGHARLTDMLETVRLVKGDAFHAVTFAAVQARMAMEMWDQAGGRQATNGQRLQVAQKLMETVRSLAQALALPPGQLAEALRHARAMYREGFQRS